MGNKYPGEALLNHYSIIAPLMKKREKLKVLDFGCSVGANSLFLQKQGLEVYGIDTSESAIHRCIESGLDENYFVAENILTGRKISEIWKDI